LHFLSADRKAGGHVLDMNTGSANASLDYTSNFYMILPGMESDFHKIDLSKDRQSEMEQSEN
jgi:acetolactate decarboxylase